MGGLFVTGLTRNCLVRPLQRKASHRVMIETCDLPILAIMTLGAVGAIFALMTVILSVAADAGARRFLDCVARSVAAFALGCRMLAYQWKVCVSIVIKCCRGPCRWGMATGAIRAS